VERTVDPSAVPPAGEPGREDFLFSDRREPHALRAREQRGAARRLEVG